jgi:hypothetical protein
MQRKPFASIPGQRLSQRLSQALERGSDRVMDAVGDGDAIRERQQDAK